MNKGKDGVERFYDSSGLTSIRVKNDGRAWSHDHHWTEFQKAVALSGVCTDREAYISAAMFEEIYVVYVTKPAIGWRVKTHVFIRFANGAWGLVDPSAYTNYLVEQEVELGNVYRVAVELYDAILLLHARRIRQLYGLVEDLNTLPLRARLAKQLLHLVRSYGIPSLSDGDEVRIGLQLAQEELAQLLGASRQRVNQELKAMEREDIIRIEPGGLFVRDRDALMHIIDTDH